MLGSAKYRLVGWMPWIMHGRMDDMYVMWLTESRSMWGFIGWMQENKKADCL